MRSLRQEDAQIGTDASRLAWGYCDNGIAFAGRAKRTHGYAAVPAHCSR